MTDTAHINLYGLFTTPSGLSVAAWNTRRTLEGLGVAMSVFDVDSSGVPKPVTAGASGAVPGINLIHLNPNWVELMMVTRGGFDYGLAGSLNVCVPFWELPLVSASWIEQLSAFDLILAPTRFILDALVRSGIDAPVVHYPQAVFLPQGVAGDRARFGIPATATAYCMSFATGSLVARKNPIAVLDAFVEAFPREQDVCLAVRVHTQATGEDDPALARLRDLASTDPRILLIEGHLEYADVLSLYASCDVYVSLHRSEGLGLGPMEAMSLGKAVIATGWSGNTDFMDDDNSCLVEFDLVRADLGAGTLYGADIEASGVSWAEPRVAHAAALMRRLYADPALRTRLGARAASDMKLRRQDAALGAFVATLQQAHAAMEADPELHAMRVGRFERLYARPEPSPRRVGLVERFKRIVVRFARRAGFRHDGAA